MIRFVLVLTAFVLGQPVLAERYALVIGNGAYSGLEPLSNATNDARDFAEALNRQGFRVTLVTDTNRRDMLETVQSFSRQLTFSDTALLFYAGHGMQIGSDNYLVPIDADATSETALQDSSVRLQSVLNSLENRAATRIVILDACRNNPFPASLGASRSAGAARGFMKLDAGVGSFIAFSTAPGAVAADGLGLNSPFTEALLRHMTNPGESIHAVMRRVRVDVMSATGNRQIPWENSALLDEVFLASAPKDTLAQSPSGQTVLQQPARPVFVATHAVRGLDPNGDGFLALREGSSTEFRMTMMLTEGTPLSVLDTSGRWYRVRTPEGIEGWAHSAWIRPETQTPLTRQPQVNARPTCDQLWHQRNSIFAARGYCFNSARGKAAFPNPSCLVGVAAGDIPLTAAERGLVASLLEQEKAQGCR